MGCRPCALSDDSVNATRREGALRDFASAVDLSVDGPADQIDDVFILGQEWMAREGDKAPVTPRHFVSVGRTWILRLCQSLSRRSMATRRATGSFPRALMMSSPASTRASSSDRWVFRRIESIQPVRDEPSFVIRREVRSSAILPPPYTTRVSAMAAHGRWKLAQPSGIVSWITAVIASKPRAA
ncbi:Hypothetical protein NGAL_HAMBI1145_13580 [Neorhizobium galegae bv. officinalis]|uniref:Uncharacterized protein n=1 Tax=Neorhizobium galegae bv. officinalis TaxID=323656 RepID=A0A0T7FC23_NEOGA|nr:Hypothetical protein NGAL_HAMBI1145_13580 [Neorhizobium galegae bv. officinalis]